MKIDFIYKDLECSLESKDNKCNLSVKSEFDFIKFASDNYYNLAAITESSFKTMFYYRNDTASKNMFDSIDSIESFIEELRKIIFKMEQNNCLD
jgi:hypothetical protein